MCAEEPASNSEEDSESKENDSTAALPPPVLGSSEGEVTLSVYATFSCRGCKAFFENVVTRLRSTYLDPGFVRYEHHDFPGEEEGEAHRAANAARVIQDRLGNEAFFEFAKRVYQNQRELGLELYASIGEEIGVDQKVVRLAANKRLYSETIAQDRQRGNELGVSAIPAIFVDGVEFKGTTLEGLEDLIES